MSSGSYLGRGDIDLNVAFLMSSDAQRRGRRKRPASPGNWISIVSARTVRSGPESEIQPSRTMNSGIKRSEFLRFF